MVGDSKRVSHQAAQLLYERYGGGPRLDGKSLVGLSIAWMYLLDLVWLDWNFWHHQEMFFMAASDWLGTDVQQTEVPC